ncbi:hypothetical protein V5N11_008455 [Cardamine amara subsp. amara]|uniref:Retrotransposon gag domain-containing protein n=1 Tax=Cardamine amara subsp. amara TaxID=228776 RepID=A0ABD1AGG5_CARAN
MKLRSNKDKELLVSEEIGKLERTNRKAQRMVKTVVLVRNTDGELLDLEGNLCNEEDACIDRRNAECTDRRNGMNVENDDDACIDRHNADRVDRRNGNGQGPNLADDGDELEEMTFGDYNRPEEFYTNMSAICPPPFQRNDFELKPQYYTLVGNHTFHAHPTEHSMDHIEKFEDLASSIKANGVSEDYMFCKLFPYSLAGEAARWLKQLKPGSLTTWKDAKKAFLENFYDDAKSEDLRNMIAQFSQGPADVSMESLEDLEHGAWMGNEVMDEQRAKGAWKALIGSRLALEQ